MVGLRASAHLLQAGIFTGHPSWCSGTLRQAQNLPVPPLVRTILLLQGFMTRGASPQDLGEGLAELQGCLTPNCLSARTYSYLTQ